MFGEKLIAELGLNSSEFETKITGAKKLTGAFSTALGQIGLGLGAGAVIGFFKSVIDRGGELQDLSEQLGITTDSLQALDYTAKQAGVSAEQMGLVYNKLTAAGADAADSTTSAAKALYSLGISAKEFSDAAPDKRLELVAKAAAAAEDKQAAFAAVSDLIGSKVAPRLTGVLQALAADGLDGVTQAAKRAGVVIEGETIKRFDDLGDRLATLKTQAVTYGSAVLSTLFDFVEGAGALAAAAVNAADGIKTSVGEGYTYFESGAYSAARAADQVAVAVEKVNVSLKGHQATADDLKKLDEARAKLKERELSDTEKINNWLDKILTLENQKAKWVRDSKEWTEAETESLGLQTKVAETRNAQVKKAAEESKKAAEEQIKIAADEQKLEEKYQAARVEQLTFAEKKREYLKQEKEILAEMGSHYEHSAEMIDAENRLLGVQKNLREAEKGIQAEQVELAKLLLVPEDKRTAIQTEQIKLLTGQTTKAQQLAEIADLTARVISGSITPAERERLAVMVGITAQAVATNDVLVKQLENVGKITNFGKSYDSQKTEELKYTQANLQSQLDAARIANQGKAGSFSFGSEFDPISGQANYGMGAVIQQQLAAISRELAARSQFESYLRMGGTALAQRIYSPQEYERLNATVNAPGANAQIASTLEEINSRLKSFFPKS